MPSPAPLPPGGLPLASAAGRWVLVCTVLASGTAMLDGTVVTIALPHIGRDLGVPMSVLQWTVNAYMLALAALILLGGGLGDRYGRRRVFVVGTVWFALASAGCALAPDGGVLIAARALQGVGGALLTPGSLAIIQAVFREEDRSRAVGAWSGLGGVATAIGPFLGGWLVDGPGWRWIFVINLPLAAAVVAIALRHVPETRDEQASGRFDTAGAAVAALALAGITYALIEAGGGGVSVGAIGAGAAGLVLAVLFVPLEHRLEREGREPMMPPGIFASRLFGSVNAVTVLLYAAIGGVFFFLPVQLQTTLGYSAFRAGIASLPITLLMLGLSSSAGELARKAGARLPLTAGPLLAAAGMVLVLRVRPGAGYWTAVFPAVVVTGLGMAVFVAPLTATVLASVDVRRSGLASGINNSAARVGQLLSVAALPAAVGLSGDAYGSPAAMNAAFHRAVLACAGLMAVGGAVAGATVGRRALRPEEPCARPECTVFGASNTPPLEPGGGGDGPRPQTTSR